MYILVTGMYIYIYNYIYMYIICIQWMNQCSNEQMNRWIHDESMHKIPSSSSKSAPTPSFFLAILKCKSNNLTLATVKLAHFANFIFGRCSGPPVFLRLALQSKFFEMQTELSLQSRIHFANFIFETCCLGFLLSSSFCWIIVTVPASAAGHGQECFRYCTLTLLSRILQIVSEGCDFPCWWACFRPSLSSRLRETLFVWLVCFCVVLLGSSRRALFRGAWRPFFCGATLLDCCVKPKGARPTFVWEDVAKNPRVLGLSFSF